ncbi:MAG: glycosyltransferase family 4 protein, partial [Bacteroidota bacterium]
RGHDVVLAARTNIFSGRIDEGIKVQKLPFRHEFDLPTIKNLLSLTKENEINIVLATKRKEYALSAILKKSAKIPVVFRLGIIRSIKKIDLPQRWVYDKVPDSIIVNAEMIKKSLLEQNIGTNEKIKVIYNGYDFDPRVDESLPFELPADKYIFASAGRLTAQKGYDILLNALAFLKKERDDFFHVIAGEGGERDKYMNFIIEHGLKDNVILPGSTDNVRGLFSRADCVVIPSRAEGIPNTLFEAWSVKKPVLAASSAGIPEAVDDKIDGLIFKPEPVDIFNKLKFALENKNEIIAYGSNGFEKMKSEFTLEKMLDETEELFLELASPD